MIHSTSIIDPSAIIGSDVKIGPYSVIGPGVKIGNKCVIHSHAVLEYVDLGAESHIYPYASIGLPPQHLGYKNEPTRVIVGERCTFRESVTVHRGSLFDKGVTVIGQDNYFMALSHVAHDCVIGNNVILANGAQLAGHVKVGNRAFISSTVGVHQFTRIGDFAMISGGAMVSLDVAPYTVAQGDRASLFGLNLVGLKRGGVDRDSIRLIKEAYKTVFLNGLSLADALIQPSLTLENKWVLNFHKFLSEPKRGFCRPVSTSMQIGEKVAE